MENFKFILFSVFILSLLGFSGYWAFSTIESGSAHVNNQKQLELEQKNANLEKEIAELKKDISLLELDEGKAKISEEEGQEDLSSVSQGSVATTTKPVVFKYQSLIDELQKLVDNKVFLKNKSKGPSVGTLQKFLNIYNNTSSKIDNDYGVSTTALVKNFQKIEGLTADGEAGPSTFLKMIDWLKSK